MTQKVLKSVIVLAIVAGLGILAYHIGYTWYDEKYGEYRRRYLSDNVVVIEYNNGTMSILNESAKKIVGRYDIIYGDNISGTIRVGKDGLEGYISAETGEVIFEPQFLQTWVEDPESGLAACLNEDKKLGFVNVKTKQVAIPFQFDFEEYDYEYYCNHCEFVFHNGICIVPGKDKKIGMIDTTGKLLLPIEFTIIMYYKEINQYYEEKVRHYTVPHYIVQKNDDKYGLFDTLFNVILPCEFDWIESQPFEEDKIIAQKDYVQKLYDNKGQIIHDFYLEDNEDVNVFEAVYENGKLTPYIKYYLDGDYGIIDDDKKVVIPAKYDKIEYLGNGVFVCTEDNYSFLVKAPK